MPPHAPIYNRLHLAASSQQARKHCKHQPHARTHHDQLPQRQAPAARRALRYLPRGAPVNRQSAAGARPRLANRGGLVGVAVPKVGQPGGREGKRGSMSL